MILFRHRWHHLWISHKSLRVRMWGPLHSANIISSLRYLRLISYLHAYFFFFFFFNWIHTTQHFGQRPLPRPCSPQSGRIHWLNTGYKIGSSNSPWPKLPIQKEWFTLWKKGGVNGLGNMYDIILRQTMPRWGVKIGGKLKSYIDISLFQLNCRFQAAKCG